jgi:DNA polymerase-4
MRRARQVAARPATANDFTLSELARRALQLAWVRRVRVRHLRLICDRLIFPPAQIELFASEQKADEKRRGLISAIDTVRHRFGHQTVRFGRTLAAYRSPVCPLPVEPVGRLTIRQAATKINCRTEEVPT